MTCIRNRCTFVSGSQTGFGINVGSEGGAGGGEGSQPGFGFNVGTGAAAGVGPGAGAGLGGRVGR